MSKTAGKKTGAGKGQTEVRVTVYPRPEILDPQGKAIGAALERLGFDNVHEVRAGKSFDIVLEGVEGAAAESLAKDMADKLLANPIVEDYAVELVGSNEGGS